MAHQASLHGIHYTAPKFTLPKAASVRDALCIFKKNLPQTVQGFMSTLERNPTTLVQTEVILKGQSVTGLSLDDLAQVKHYGDGAKLLIRMLEENTFALTEECVCKIHNLTAKDEALTWGKFRDSDVSIGGVAYLPPKAEGLPVITSEGFAHLETLTCPVEKAIVTFLFMSRSQFFSDGRACIVATGNTQAKKELLKGAGFQCNPKNMAWWRHQCTENTSFVASKQKSCSLVYVSNTRRFYIFTFPYN